MHEGGLIDHWIDLYDPHSRGDDCAGSKPSVSSLQLEDTTYIYIYLLAVPLFVSILVICAEMIIWVSDDNLNLKRA